MCLHFCMFLHHFFIFGHFHISGIFEIGAAVLLTGDLASECPWPQQRLRWRPFPVAAVAAELRSQFHLTAAVSS